MKSSRLAQKQPLPYQVSFQLGFTLIEIIIAITILAIMTTIGIASFSSANSGNDVRQQVQELKSVVRRLRTDALASRKPVNCQDPISPSTYFGTYIAFGLQASGSPVIRNTYRSGSACYFNSSGSAVPNLSQTVSYKNTSIINQSLGRDDGRLSNQVLTVVFLTSGDVFFLNSFGFGSPPSKPIMQTPTNSGGYNPSGRVWLVLGNGSNSYRLTINRVGLICDELTTASPSCAE